MVYVCVSYFLLHIKLVVIIAAISRWQCLGTRQERTFRGPEEHHSFSQNKNKQDTEMSPYLSRYVTSAQSAREDAHNYRLEREGRLFTNTLQTLPKQMPQDGYKSSC
jgi:hypothetical protein